MSTVFQNGIASSTSSADAFIRNKMVITGSVFWIDLANGNDSNAGTEEKPFKTLGQAISSATANNGDVIVIKSGGSVTLTSTITINKAGVKIFGLGAGTARAQFIVGITSIYGLTISSNDVEVNNLYFPKGTSAANTGRISVNADSVRVINCGFDCGANDADSIVVNSSGISARIEGCTFTVVEAGPATGIKVANSACRNLRIDTCSFDGGTGISFSSAAIYSTVAHLDFVYKNCTLVDGADIIHTAAAKGWVSGIVTGYNCQVSI